MQPVRTDPTLRELLSQGRIRAAWAWVEAAVEEGVSRVHDAPLDWYEGLTHDGKNRVDQALHALAGFGLAAVGSAALAWHWAHHREFVEQAPIERVWDTERDMRHVLYGAWAGQIFFTGWTVTVAVLIVRMLGGT